MTTIAVDPVRDTMTMLRRRLLHLRRYPTLTMFLVGTPVLFLVLFVYVFGGTLGDGLGPDTNGRGDYLPFLAPTILVLAVASVATGTAGAVANDMASGVMARFRTMAIAPASVVAGHVLGALVQSALAVGVVGALAVALGYRPDAAAADYVLAAGVLGLVAFAFTWLTVAFGLAAKSVETATNLPMLLVLLPFLGSGFVPTESMPTGLRWFAEHQPFTPVINSIRGLLGGAGNGHDVAFAVGWAVLLAAVGWACAVRLYRRDRAR